MVFSCLSGRIQAAVLSALLIMSSLPAMAQSNDPEQIIRTSVNQLMSQLEGRKDYYVNHPGELKQVVENSLSHVADFRYIGASVMGRYFSNATPEQRSRFANVFRQTLIDTYAKGLVTFDYRELRVLNNQQAERYEDQANVTMEVVATDGKVFPVSYTMRLSDGQWKVVNVIVNGINLGLTFRNQFDQAMRQKDRNYDAVINSWSPDLDAEELERGGNS
ncbi:MlaC/ttg2D family ABC transporter substrate-binding protein [Halomonas halocynthiae]|uniref:MlaC/ttg2D family ABC transporter substrate-binding protein n=1 Tax=Halomonas halocynthiae TaxID=176290 RepID=UPI000426C4E0|nr:ABC transporter substrate-binding protein [Halomonas halocynthiae]